MGTLQEKTLETKLPAAYFYNNEGEVDSITGEIENENDYGWTSTSDLELFEVNISETENNYRISVTCEDDKITLSSNCDSLIIALINKELDSKIPLDTFISWDGQENVAIGIIRKD